MKEEGLYAQSGEEKAPVLIVRWSEIKSYRVRLMRYGPGVSRSIVKFIRKDGRPIDLYLMEVTAGQYKLLENLFLIALHKRIAYFNGHCVIGADPIVYKPNIFAAAGGLWIIGLSATLVVTCTAFSLIFHQTPVQSTFSVVLPLCLLIATSKARNKAKLLEALNIQTY
jgi:hypothetical protein